MYKMNKISQIGNLLKILKYFVIFPVRAFISCEQSSQVHGEKDGLLIDADDESILEGSI